MRRVLLSGLAVFVMALALSPAQLVVTSGRPSVQLTAALADSGIKTDPCVQLGVPISGKSSDAAQCVDNSQGSGGAIVNYLKLILKFLSGAVGLVILLMLMIAGIQYITSTGDPKLVTNAKNRIINAITALVLFILAFAILSFIIPGGIL